MAHAPKQGKQVIAVVAGHMHHALRGGGQRVWRVEQDGVLYVNAAHVPRVARRYGRSSRHHLLLRWDGQHARVEPVWVA